MRTSRGRDSGGGIPDQVGPHGYLVEPGDADALAAAIGRALAEVERGCIRHADISRYATARFSIEAMVEGHLALYRRLLSRRAAAATVAAGLQGGQSRCQLPPGALGPRLAGKGLLTG